MAGGDDSIDFFARYKGWVVARSIACSASTSPKEVSAFLAAVRDEAAERAFTVLGIGTESLSSYSEELAGQFKKGDYAAAAGIYKALGSADAEAKTGAAAQNRAELRPFARAYLFRSAMRNLGLMWYIESGSMVFGSKVNGTKASSAVPFESEGISFMAKYRDWISIKKLSIHDNTKPEEVSAHLSSVRMAADRKTAQILGVQTDSLDAYASTVTEKMRKSAANIEKIAAVLSSAEAKKELDQACSGDQPLRDIAVIYLFGRMLQDIKVDLEVSPDTLMDMFPGLKIPKPKGRMPGQKKKKQQA